MSSIATQPVPASAVRACSAKTLGFLIGGAARAEVFTGFARGHGRAAMDMYTESKSVCMLV